MMLQKKSLNLDIAGHASHKHYSDAISEKITLIIIDANEDKAKAFIDIKKLIEKTKITLKEEVLLGNKNVNDIIKF